MDTTFKCKRCSSTETLTQLITTYCTRCVRTRVRGLEFLNPSKFEAYVYGLYDDEDLLIYIGVTNDPVVRCHTHILTKKFSYMRVVHCFGSRSTADHYEKFAIDNRKPVLNKLIDDRFTVLGEDWPDSLKSFGQVKKIQPSRKKKQQKSQKKETSKQKKAREAKERQLARNRLGPPKPQPTKQPKVVHYCAICHMTLNTKNRNKVKVQDAQGRTGYLHGKCYSDRLAIMGK